MKLEWSPCALRDLEHIRDFIGQDSAFYAWQFTERLLAAAKNLADFPRIGRSVPEADYQDAIRKIIFHNYRIIYRIRHENLLQIVTVSHSSRDLSSMVKKPWDNSQAIHQDQPTQNLILFNTSLSLIQRTADKRHYKVPYIIK